MNIKSLIDRSSQESANMSTHSAVKSRNISNAAKPDKPKKNELVVFYRKFSKKSKSKDVGARSIREAQESSSSNSLSKRGKRRAKKMESEVSSRSSRKTDPKRKSKTNANLRNHRRDERVRTRQSNEKLLVRSQRKSKCPKWKSAESVNEPAVAQKSVMIVPPKQLEKLKERLAKPTPPVVQAKAPQEKAKGPSETICFPKARTPAKPMCRSPKQGARKPEEDVRTVLEILDQHYEPSTKVEDNKNFNAPVIVLDVQAMRMVPFWQLPVTDEENDEMCEELEDKVIDKEMCQRMIKGAIQVVKAVKPTLDAEGDGELEDMEKLDQGYFDFEVVVGNTLKTVLFGLDEQDKHQGEKAHGAMQHKPVPIAFNEPKTAKFYDPSKKLAALELKEDRRTASGIKLN